MRLKVKIINGKYKGEVGTLKSILWAANIAIVLLDTGEEIVVKPIEVNVI